MAIAMAILKSTTVKQEKSLRKEEYSKLDSMFVAGIALLMMFYYHFFAFPEFLPASDCYYAPIKHMGIPIQQIIAHFGQLCVGMFAFNTGYIIAKKPSAFSDYKHIFQRLCKFLAAYWIICILFLCYGIIFQVKLPSLGIFLQNLFGYNVSARADFVNVAHGWYVSYYIFLMLLTPIILKALQRSNWYIDASSYAIIILFLPTLPTKLLEVIWPLSASLAGSLTYKYSIFGLMGGGKQKMLRIVVSTLVFIAVFVIRHEFQYLNEWGRLDGFFAFGVIFSILIIIDMLSERFKKLMSWIGATSMYFWFLHSIFVVKGNMFISVLYKPQYSLLITLWGLIMMCPFVWLCNRLIKKIIR